MSVDKSNNMFDRLDMRTIADIARAFGTQQEMADACSVKRGRVEQWCRRNSIPSGMLVRVVKAAQERGIDLTIDELAEIVADQDDQAA